MGTLRVGRVYRYARPYNSAPGIIDGLPNYFAQVDLPTATKAVLERGINPVGQVKTPHGRRVPAILLSSSPHKGGFISTPWRDLFDSDHGLVRYYGDAKGKLPETMRGNAALLSQFAIHSSPDPVVRADAVPILAFERVSYEGRAKGNLRFHGVGVIARAERVVQPLPKSAGYFVNYVFELCVLRLDAENDELDWEWINARRSSSSTSGTSGLAPQAWRQWLAEGHSSLPRVRRLVSRASIVPDHTQRPTAASREDRVLNEVYEYYGSKKRRFEFLAMRVTAEHLRGVGITMHEGWVTPGGGDGGADFVGRIDLGRGFGAARLVLLGQAKCEKPTSPTGGNHIARTVARLRRGWVGAYVTTSYFSKAVQHEVYEDEYPLLLINGAMLARIVAQLADAAGKSVGDFLVELDAGYDGAVSSRRPSEVLHQ